MGVLTKDEILLLLKLVGEKTVVRPTEEFPYRVSCEGFGYAPDDPVISGLQAKLSIMLEVAGQK